MFSLTLLLPLLTLSLPLATAFSSADARSKSVYQIVTDRFATTAGNSPTCDVPGRGYCGGTWKGIQGKLSYIKGMGFDTIWISPIVANIGGTTSEGAAYHGYWTSDITQLNSNFGTSSDLKDLVTAVHAAGMYIMVDVVVNHVAATSTSTFQASSSYGPFNNTSTDFHPFCFISDYTNQTNVEQCWLGDTTVSLPDLNTESPTVVSTFNSWIKQLVSTYSIDSLRIDTVKHVRKDFWPAFVSAGGVYAVGEVLDGGAAYVAGYQNNSMDGLFNYPMYYPLIRAFNTTTATMTELTTAISLNRQQFKDTTYLGNFVDNHDNPRIGNYTTDQGLVKNILTYPFVTDGIPFWYYGTEQGFTGGNDPANREPLWTSSYSTSSPLYSLATKLNAIRTAARNSSTTYHTNAVTVLTTSDTSSKILAISKSPLVAVLSNLGSSGATTTISVTGAGFTANQQLVELMSCTAASADGSGNLANVTITAGAPMVYISREKAGGVCSNLLGTVIQTVGSATPSATTTTGAKSGALPVRGVGLLGVAMTMTVGAMLA